MKHTVLIILLFFLIDDLNAQQLIVPTNQVTFGSKLHTNRDVLDSSLKDGNNDIYLIGTTENDFSFNDIQVIKLNTGLSELWRKTISFDTDFSYDRLLNSFIDSQDNLILVCRSAFNKAEEIIIVLKINSLGEEIWRLPLSDLQNPVGVIPDQRKGFLGVDDTIHITYEPWEVRLVNPTERLYLEISSDGQVVSQYSRNPIFTEDVRIIGEIEFYNGYYYYVLSEKTDFEPFLKYSVVRFNEAEYTKKEIQLSEEQIQLIILSENHFLKFDKQGNFAWIALHDFEFNQFDYNGYTTFFFSSEGNLLNIQETDKTKDKYVIGCGYNTDDHLIVSSNDKDKNADGNLALSFIAYDTNGIVINTRVNQNELGRLIVLTEGFIGVYTESNKILKYDQGFNPLGEIILEPINAALFNPESILSINANIFLGGTNLSPIYEGSIFFSQQDWSLKKTNNSSEITKFNFTGKGTSNTYRNKSIQKNGEGNYLVAITEKAGPELFVGGTLAPDVSQILTYNQNLDIVNQTTVNAGIDNDIYNNIWIEKPSNKVAFSLNGQQYEYVYDYDSNELQLLKNGLLEWIRTWNTADNDIPSVFLVDSKGNLIFKTNLSGIYKPALNKITLNNELDRTIIEKNPEHMILLENDWVFTANSLSTTVYSNSLDYINESALAYDINPTYTAVRQKNNKVIIQTVLDKILRIYDQYGVLENTFILDGDLRDRFAFLDNNDLIVMGSISRTITDTYKWQRTTISRYEDFVGFYLGETSFGDNDEDGVSDFYDRCPFTSSGDLVDSYGCNAIILENDNFLIKTTTESCPASGNASIEITADKIHDYTAVLSKDLTNISSISFTENLIFQYLEAGFYTVCITVNGNSEISQCFDLTIDDTKKLFVSSKFDMSSNNLQLTLSGSDNYNVNLNGKLFITSSSEITLELNQLVNKVEITTNNECQGTYTQIITTGSLFKIYPNPVDDGYLNIELGTYENEKLSINVYGINGQEIICNKNIIEGNVLQIDMNSFQDGLYFLNVKTEDVIKTYKIVKK